MCVCVCVCRLQACIHGNDTYFRCFARLKTIHTECAFSSGCVSFFTYVNRLLRWQSSQLPMKRILLVVPRSSAALSRGASSSSRFADRRAQSILMPARRLLLRYAVPVLPLVRRCVRFRRNELGHDARARSAATHFYEDTLVERWVRQDLAFFNARGRFGRQRRCEWR